MTPTPSVKDVLIAASALKEMKMYAEDYYNDILHKPQEHDASYIDGLVALIEDIDRAIERAAS